MRANKGLSLKKSIAIVKIKTVAVPVDKTALNILFFIIKFLNHTSQVKRIAIEIAAITPIENENT